MKPLSGHEIRSRFLEFYEKKLHKQLPSASLIPNDPQLLFTVAGMVPFKPIFWGKVEPTYPRVTTCQKCVRTNDIEQVGKTPRHHTFFEMLGNFSFGDYFKEEAIKWAWEFITEVIEMPQEKIWVSVYKDDEEALRIWTDEIGFPREKIVKLGKEDNFWGPAGPTGPCGPDSEIFFDRGPQPGCPDPDNCNPACECGRFLEFYNLVFTEFNQDEKGNLSPLARKNIDTGLGLERLTAIMQGVSSNYETDLFIPIIEQVEKITGMKYGESENENIALRVIADHVRSAIFMINDGVLPSNDGRGYVLKRLIRRALRFGWLHQVKEPFLYKVIPSVVKIMGGHYIELKDKEAFIEKIVKNEEVKFLITMEQGLDLLDKIISEKNQISGEDVFKLYDTFGFPVEVTLEIAEEKGIEVNLEEYEKLMLDQKKKAREARGEREFLKTQEIYENIGSSLSPTVFEGYDKLETTSEIRYILKEDTMMDRIEKDQTAELLVSNTPFYDEKGGQVSDSGLIISDTGKAQVLSVFNPFNKIISHEVKIIDGYLLKNQKVKLAVDPDTRIETARNHSATHLLHSALKNVLGEHVKQAGSYVTPKRLRFDFSHFEPVQKEQLEEVEKIVNKQIMNSVPVITVVKSLEEARKDGATALFEEKYADEVRVVSMGEFSSELCGGTHVSNTGQIGPFKIISENGISSGVRRIEAITGWNTYEYYKTEENSINTISGMLNSDSAQLVKSVEKNINELKEMAKKIKSLEEKMANSKLDNIEIKTINGHKYGLILNKGLQKEVLRNLSDTAIEKVGSGVVIILNETENNVSIVVRVSKDLAGKEIHAGNTAKKLAQYLDGNGGGRPDFAQAGGKNPSKIPQLIENIQNILE